jgi:hypothetical protein
MAPAQTPRTAKRCAADSTRRLLVAFVCRTTNRRSGSMRNGLVIWRRFWARRAEDFQAGLTLNSLLIDYGRFPHMF